MLSGSSLKRILLRALGPLVFCLGILVLALMIVDVVLVDRVSTHVQDITRLWKNQPIVSIYVSTNTQEEEVCALGFDALPLSNAAFPGTSTASCGCTQNPYGYSSSIAPCFAQGEHSGYCMPLKALPPVESLSWRGSTLRVKRAGHPAATYKGHYAGRAHPNKHGHCPSGFKKCGDGRNQDEGAICFPVDAECPVTNIIVLPNTDFPPANEGWEPAGTFLNDNHTLYFRREHIGELPIMNVTVALTEFACEHNTRGQCFRGEIQSPGLIQGSKTSLWSYYSALPPACEDTDPRYKLADQISQEEGYLKSVQVTEPACAGFQLFSLDDPRYNQSSDPDYLNNGVKCGFDPRYVCVRDSNQRTNCIAGDDICDGVVNQNICGEYARAVRSAFSDSTVTLGFYYVREIEWSDQCNVSKREIFNYRKIPVGVIIACIIGVVFFLVFTFTLYAIPLEVEWGRTIEQERMEHSCTHIFFAVCPALALLTFVLVQMSKVSFLHYISTHHF